jgi:hypothetical protein
MVMVHGEALIQAGTWIGAREISECATNVRQVEEGGDATP